MSLSQSAPRQIQAVVEDVISHELVDRHFQQTQMTLWSRCRDAWEGEGPWHAPYERDDGGAEAADEAQEAPQGHES